MTTQEDPISKIKKAEEEVTSSFEKASEKSHKDLAEYELELAKKTLEFDADLREKGNLKLETIKKEAGELFKKRVAEAEKTRTEVINSAESSESKAVDAVIDSFMAHIDTK